MAYLHDDRDAWDLQVDGTYVRANAPGQGTGVQDALMQRYGPAPRSSGQTKSRQDK